MVEANQSYIRPPPPSPKSKQTDNHLFRPLENLNLDYQGKGLLGPCTDVWVSEARTAFAWKEHIMYFRGSNFVKFFFSF